MTAWKRLEARVAAQLGGTRTHVGSGAVSDVIGTPWSVEVKRSKRGVPEGRWIEQAREQGRREKRPWLLVVARHNDRNPIVVLDFATFLELTRAARPDREAA